MIRAFVAVELTTELRNAIARVQEQLKQELTQQAPVSRLQWVRPDSIHLTLKFLGDIEDRRVEDIRQALGLAVGTSPAFSVEVAGLGVFPDLRAPRVVWVGFSNEGDELVPLVRLAGQVDRALGELGYELESRPFSPHLTLARVRDRSREIGQALSRSGLLAERFPLGQLEITAVCLMRSDLRPTGAIYTRLCEAPLLSHEER